MIAWYWAVLLALGAAACAFWVAQVVAALAMFDEWSKR